MRHAEMEIVSQCLLRCGLVLYGPRPLPKSLGSRGTEQSRGRGLLVKINMLLNLCERPLSLKVTRLVSCNPENHSVHQQLGKISFLVIEPLYFFYFLVVICYTKFVFL